MTGADLGEEIARIATVLGGRVTPVATWFDGFWDFVVDNQDWLRREPAWEIQGLRGPSWALEIFASPDPARPLFELYLFVENKDRRPGVSAPWPVSSIVLDGGGPVETGARDRFDRPHDHALAQELLRRGFRTLVGYWGVRCETHVPRDDPRGPDRVGAILSALPDVLPLAFNLAAGLPA